MHQLFNTLRSNVCASTSCNVAAGIKEIRYTMVLQPIMSSGFKASLETNYDRGFAKSGSCDEDHSIPHRDSSYEEIIVTIWPYQQRRVVDPSMVHCLCFNARALTLVQEATRPRITAGPSPFKRCTMNGRPRLAQRHCPKMWFHLS